LLSNKQKDKTLLMDLVRQIFERRSLEAIYFQESLENVFRISGKRRIKAGERTMKQLDQFITKFLTLLIEFDLFEIVKLAIALTFYAFLSFLVIF
jgi:hypothetical protein